MVSPPILSWFASSDPGVTVFFLRMESLRSLGVSALVPHPCRLEGSQPKPIDYCSTNCEFLPVISSSGTLPIYHNIRLTLIQS